MKDKKKKAILWAVIISVAGCAYILFQTLGVPAEGKTIMDFMGITTIIPIVVLVVSGIILGRENKLKQSWPYLLLVTVVVCGASVFSMTYLYNAGHVFEMLQNTQVSDGVSLNINDKITAGTIVQQAVICLACAFIGNGIGGKTVGILNKIKN